MAKKDYTANQIIRLDGNKCFMEVLNDAFTIGKVHMGFYTYDVSNAKGSRFTNNIQIYLGIPEFLALAQEISSGRLARKAQMSLEQSKQTQAFPAAVFESMGGTSAAKLRKMGQGRADKMGISRQFRINSGTKKPFLLNAEAGPGEADAKGLIVPRFKLGQGEHKVMVPVDHNMMLRMAETVRLHIQAYLSAFYLTNPVEKQGYKADEQDDTQGGYDNSSSGSFEGETPPAPAYAAQPAKANTFDLGAM